MPCTPAKRIILQGQVMVQGLPLETKGVRRETHLQLITVKADPALVMRRLVWKTDALLLLHRLKITDNSQGKSPLKFVSTVKGKSYQHAQAFGELPSRTTHCMKNVSALL